MWSAEIERMNVPLNFTRKAILSTFNTFGQVDLANKKHDRAAPANSPDCYSINKTEWNSLLICYA